MNLMDLAGAIERLKHEFFKAGVQPPTDIVVPRDAWLEIRSSKDSLMFFDASSGTLHLREMLLLNGVRIRPEPWKSEDGA